MQIFEQSRVEVVDEGPVVRTARGEVHADHVVLATNVFPSLLRRNRLQTVPVYDYVLVTEPLSAEQKAAIGWQGRQGVADLANHFHYYRLTADDRILFGGYDAVYHWGGRVRAAYEDRPETYAKLASHLLTTFPQLEGLRISHRWAGAIDTCSRFCAFYGTARQGRVAYAAGFTGLGVGASRFAADVMLDLLAGDADRADRAGHGAGAPAPVPAGTAGLDGDPADRLVDAPGGSSPGPPQPAAEGPRRGREWASTPDDSGEKDPPTMQPGAVLTRSCNNRVRRGWVMFGWPAAGCGA